MRQHYTWLRELAVTREVGMTTVAHEVGMMAMQGAEKAASCGDADGIGYCTLRQGWLRKHETGTGGGGGTLG